jgi:hypothetical protein
MDNVKFITLIVAVFGCTGFWQFLMWFIQHLLSKKSVQHKALLAILQDRIYWLCSKYIDRGSITKEELRVLLQMYEPYIDMGGNGVAKSLKEEVDNLPITTGRYQ